MPVVTTTTEAAFTGTGVLSTYTPGFYVQEARQVVVTVNGNQQTLGDDYEVLNVGDVDGCDVRAVFPLGSAIFIERHTSITQEVDTQNNETILQDVLDNALDKLTMICQELDPTLGRAVLVPVVETSVVIPPIATRANKALGFDAAGIPIAVNVGGSIVINVKDAPFNAQGDGLTDDYAAILAAWTYCVANKRSLFFPGGTYLVVGRNFPFTDTTTAGPLKDCGNITIMGEGPTSILVTQPAFTTFDIQHCANLHFRNLKLTLANPGTRGNAHAIHVSGGFDNITIDNVHCENFLGFSLSGAPLTPLQGTIDGPYPHQFNGAALLVETADTNVYQGRLTANMYAKNCCNGFVGVSGIQFDATDPSPNVSVNMVASRCYIAAMASCNEQVFPWPNRNSAYKVAVRAIDCQRDLVLYWAFGGDYDIIIQTDTEIANRTLVPGLTSGFPNWNRDDPFIEPVFLSGVNNANIRVRGSKGFCSSVASIGPGLTGSALAGGNIVGCNISLDISNVSDTPFVPATINALDTGSGDANTIDCVIRISERTVPGGVSDPWYASNIWAPTYGVSNFRTRSDIQVGTGNKGIVNLTMLGVVGAPVVPCAYIRTGEFVTLHTIGGNFATSNTTYLELTGLPPLLTPEFATVATGLMTVRNAGVDGYRAEALVGPTTFGFNNIMLKLLGVVGTATGAVAPFPVSGFVQERLFTNSGSKGVSLGTITYQLQVAHT